VATRPIVVWPTGTGLASIALPRADPDALAYAVVRITEGFIYNDAILAVEPAVDEAAAIVALLLG
jgi:hypothetical protein